MEAKLVIVSGKTNKRDVKLKLPSVIGRSREADLTIAHPMISRRHCQLFEADGFVKIKDLGSLNGTFVYGKRIEQEVLLRPNDEFTIGPLTFRVEYETPEGVLVPSPPVHDETPEYIPSFGGGSTEPPSRPSSEAEPPEIPAQKSGFPEAAGSAELPAKQPATGESMEAQEAEFDFELAEDLATEAPQEAQESPPEGKELAEVLPFKSKQSPPSKPNSLELPVNFAEDEFPPEQEALLQEPEESPAEKAPSKAAPGPSDRATPSEPLPSANLPSSALSPESPPTEENQALDNDLDEIEDAALRDFLKGLR